MPAYALPKKFLQSPRRCLLPLLAENVHAHSAHRVVQQRSSECLEHRLRQRGWPAWRRGPGDNVSFGWLINYKMSTHGTPPHQGKNANLTVIGTKPKYFISQVNVIKINTVLIQYIYNYTYIYTVHSLKRIQSRQSPTFLPRPVHLYHILLLCWAKGNVVQRTGQLQISKFALRTCLMRWNQVCMHPSLQSK